MLLAKGDYQFKTNDETVIRAYKLNGFVEVEEAKPSPAKAEPKATKKK